YGKGRMYSDPGNVPDGYNEDDPKLGRPQKSISSHGKQDSNFGKDPLGTKRMKDTDKNDSRDSRTDTNKSGLSLESAQVTYLKNIDTFKKMHEKKLIFEQDKQDSTLLDESQLKG
ncbi:hypothetical protein BVX94_02550, partial [bacterium B17]